MSKKLDFARLFADPKNAELSVKLGDAEFTIADLVEYDKQRGGEVMAEIKRQQADLEKQRNELATASTKVAETYVELEAEKRKLASQRPTNTTVEDPLAAYERDEVLGPVVKSLRTQQSNLEKLQADLSTKLDAINKNLGAQGVALVTSKAARDFADIMQQEDPVRPKDLSLEALHKIAVERRMYDRSNMPDIKAAYNELTRDARHAHELEAAREDERNKIAAEQAEAAMLPIPGIHNARQQQGAEPPAKNLNDAFAKARVDKDMWKEVNTATLVGGGGIQ